MEYTHGTVDTGSNETRSIADHCGNRHVSIAPLPILLRRGISILLRKLVPQRVVFTA